jgi:prepilin-type processing-associated H-X9-DG protein
MRMSLRLVIINKLVLISTSVVTPAFAPHFAVNAQSQQGYTICVSRNLPVSFPPGVPDNVISELRFGSYRLKESTGTLKFRNVFQRKVLAIETSIEYQNEGDPSVMVVPFVAIAPQGRSMFHGILHTELINELSGGLPPGRMKHLNGQNFAIVRICPTKAAVGYFHVLFADGHSAEWEAKGWATDPEIKEVPLAVEFSCDFENLNAHVSLQAKINSEGKVSELYLLKPGGWPCFDSLKRSFEKWIFYPALHDGNPSDSAVNMILRFRSESPKDMHEYDVGDLEELSGPTVTTDFVAVRAKPNNWVVVYGPEPFGRLE